LTRKLTATKPKCTDRARVVSNPLEHYLASTPAVFDQPENTDRIYEAFRDWVGFKPAFRTDQAAVEVSTLNGDHRGYVVLVNHSPQQQNYTVFADSSPHSVTRIMPEGPKAVQLERSNWKMRLGPYEGTVVEWK
jgi:hypothetical protein